MEQKPWWQNMKHDWTVDQLDSMICRRCGLRAKSKHEGEQHECVPEKVKFLEGEPGRDLASLGKRMSGDTQDFDYPAFLGGD